MKTLFTIFMLVISLLLMDGPELTWQSSSRLDFMGTAEAIVGAPLTPVSVAGVARRTTRRTVVATEAAVATTAAASKSAPPPPPAQPTTVVVVSPPPTAGAPVSAVPVGTVVQTLPHGCTTITVSGVNYSDCGGVFYKAAFQGNNLVYVAVEKPFK